MMNKQRKPYGAAAAAYKRTVPYPPKLYTEQVNVRLSVAQVETLKAAIAESDSPRQRLGVFIRDIFFAALKRKQQSKKKKEKQQ